jgi:hypothetical protein
MQLSTNVFTLRNSNWGSNIWQVPCSVDVGIGAGPDEPERQEVFR